MMVMIFEDSRFSPIKSMLQHAYSKSDVKIVFAGGVGNIRNLMDK